MLTLTGVGCGGVAVRSHLLFMQMQGPESAVRIRRGRVGRIHGGLTFLVYQYVLVRFACAHSMGELLAGGVGGGAVVEGQKVSYMAR